jgi:hypothetical protein
MNLWETLTNTPESERLDYVIREYEKLERRLATLVDMLVQKNLITHDEAVRLRTQDPP